MEIIELPEHKRGDRWPGITIGPVDFGGSPPSYPLVSCRLYFRTKQGHRFSYGFKYPSEAGYGEITILDVDNWEVKFPEQELPLEAGQYDWDFEVTDSSSALPTTLCGGTITVTRDETYDD